jgi:hypothetical protein
MWCGALMNHPDACTHGRARHIYESGHPPKMRKRTSTRQRINFYYICEVIQTSDGFSRHLETFYGHVRWLKRLRRVVLFFLPNREPTLEKFVNPHIRGSMITGIKILPRPSVLVSSRHFLSRSELFHTWNACLWQGKPHRANYPLQSERTFSEKQYSRYINYYQPIQRNVMTCDFKRSLHACLAIFSSIWKILSKIIGRTEAYFNPMHYRTNSLIYTISGEVPDLSGAWTRTATYSNTA